MQGELICSFLIVLLSIFLTANTLTDVSQAPAPYADASRTQVYIVTTEQPPEGLDPETYYIKILSPVLGSEKAAKDALLYSYRTILSGFAAKLTPYQAAQLKKQPGVVSGTKEKIYGIIDL